MLKLNAPQHDRSILLTLPTHTFNPTDPCIGSLRVAPVGDPINNTLDLSFISLDILLRKDGDNCSAVVLLHSKTILDNSKRS